MASLSASPSTRAHERLARLAQTTGALSSVVRRWDAQATCGAPEARRDTRSTAAHADLQVKGHIVAFEEQDANRFKPPESVLISARPAAEASNWAQGWRWVGDSYRMFRAAPLPWLLQLIGLFVFWVMFTVVPFFGGVVGTVLGPVFAGGILLGCAELARTGRLPLDSLIRGFQDASFGQLALLGLLNLAASIAVGIVLSILFLVLLGASLLSSGLDFGGDIMGQLGDLMAGDGLWRRLQASLVGIFLMLSVSVVLAGLTLMAFWFAPARIIFDGQTATAAIADSFSACFKSFRGLTTFGLGMAGLGLLACIPMLLGLLVVIPMSLASTYVVYCGVFRPAGHPNSTAAAQ